MRAAAVVFAAVGFVSALVGVVWAFLAPVERLLVVDPERGTALTGESAHRFDAAAVFVLLGVVTAVLTTAAAWRWKRARGPIMLLAVLLGSLVGAFLMRAVGEAVAEQLHPRPVTPAVHSIIEFAPTVEGWPFLIAQPLVAVLVVLFLAALSTSDDLGTGEYLPFGRLRPEPVVYAPPQFGSDIRFGPYYGPGANGGVPQQAGPREPVVPFDSPVPEQDNSR
ncbi:DUF2567 domain-containing protein [Nocardia sp. 2]|uniref:DUF2567 domain-containing protein n=1 Tax=Nocardia acididurans TaxID=2802282 RepID=A0ABS1MBF2_9NOCA|nr:DUF2567 domain-containing protein [Nocardia acididurans]